MATAFLLAVSLVLSVALQRALRRLRADGQDETALYAFVRQVGLLTSALTVAAFLFMLGAAFLSSTSSQASVAAAFAAERRLEWLRSWMQVLAVPWPASVGVLLAVFLLSMQRALTSEAEDSKVLWLAKAVAAKLKGYSKMLTCLNLILGVACSLTLFGSAIDVDTHQFKVRLRQARERIEKIGNAARQIAKVEAQAAAAAAVLASPPRVIERAAEAVVRLDEAIVATERTRARARTEYRIQSRGAERRAASETARRAAARRPSNSVARPATEPAEVSAYLGTTISVLEETERELSDRLGSADFRGKAQMIADLEARKALTGSLVKKVAKKSLATALSSSNGLTLSEMVVGVVLDAIADAANRNVESWASAWVIARLRNDPARPVPPFVGTGGVITESEASALGAKLWASATLSQTDALESAAAQADRQTTLVHAERDEIARRIGEVVAVLDGRREAALARISRALASGDRAGSDVAIGSSTSSRSVVADLRAQELTYASVEGAETMAASLEANRVTDERPAATQSASATSPTREWLDTFFRRPSGRGGTLVVPPGLITGWPRQSPLAPDSFGRPVEPTTVRPPVRRPPPPRPRPPVRR
jgi:hypothetical protein